MTVSGEIRHSLASAPAPLVGGPFPSGSLESLPIEVLIKADPRTLAVVLAQVGVWASALQEPTGRDNARMLLLARAIAASRAKCIILEATRDERLSSRDEPAVRLLTMVLASETKRFALLLSEHRLGCSVGHRGSVTVAVGQAGTVNIAAGTGG